MPPAVRCTYNYKDADFTGLRRALNLIPWNILNNLDVDSAVCMFYDLVFAAISDHVSLIELRQKFPPWFNRSVHNLLREKGSPQA